MTKNAKHKNAPIIGTLDPWFETGTEGIIWSLIDPSKQGYDGLNPIKNGDILRVFKDEARTILLWEGEVKLEYKRRYRPFPRNPQWGQQEVWGMWVHGFQADLPPKKWAKWFFDGNPAILIPKSAQPKPSPAATPRP